MSPAPKPNTGGALSAELYRELREAKQRAASAEAAAKDMEGALAQYEATLAAAISANSSKQTEAAGRVGLLEAQSARVSAEYADLLSKFEALGGRYAEYKTKYAAAVANEGKWAAKVKEARCPASPFSLRSA